MSILQGAKSVRIHLLTSLTEKTEGMIGSKQLSPIKDGATLINAGRAKLVQREAFLEELKKERFTAILDVHYKEPLPEDSPFRQLKNVILTPHNAGVGTRSRYLTCVLGELSRFFKGEPLQHEVTIKRVETMTDEVLVGF